MGNWTLTVGSDSVTAFSTQPPTNTDTEDVVAHKVIGREAPIVTSSGNVTTEYDLSLVVLPEDDDAMRDLLALRSVITVTDPAQDADYVRVKSSVRTVLGPGLIHYQLSVIRSI